jgi:hypothetical protein
MPRKVFLFGLFAITAAAAVIILIQNNFFVKVPEHAAQAAYASLAASISPAASPSLVAASPFTPSVSPSASSASVIEGGGQAANRTETGYVKPKEFTEGLFIKKYPGNYACFKFETPGGVKIVTDPYNMDETISPDIVTESHQHEDHADTARLSGSYKLITEVGEYSVKGVKIKGFPGEHNKGDNAVTNRIFLFDIEGIKIAHFASQGELPDLETVRKLGNPDILLIQACKDEIYDKLTLSDCAGIIDSLKPKIVIEEHGSAGYGAKLAEYFKLPDEYASNGEIYITKRDLEEIEGFKVLDLDTEG